MPTKAELETELEASAAKISKLEQEAEQALERAAEAEAEAETAEAKGAAEQLEAQHAEAVAEVAKLREARELESGEDIPGVVSERVVPLDFKEQAAAMASAFSGELLKLGVKVPPDRTAKYAIAFGRLFAEG